MSSTSLYAAAFVVLVAVVSDVATKHIPNTATLGGLVAGLAIQLASGFVDGGVPGALRCSGLALVGAIACAIVPFGSWRKGQLGGGDVKLFAALGALLGPAAGFDVVLWTFVIAGVVLVPYRLLRYRALGAALENARIGVGNVLRRRESRMPYRDAPKLPPVILAPSIGLAFVITLLQRGALS